MAPSSLLSKKQIVERLGHAPDFINRDLKLNGQFTVTCFYLESIVDTQPINEFIIKAITDSNLRPVADWNSPVIWAEELIPHLISKIIDHTDDCIASILEGKCLLVLGDFGIALSYDVAKSQYRTISEPQSESVIRGPHEGFIEGINENVALLRKRLRNENLTFESWTIGTQTKTKLYLSYIKGIASDELISEFRKRLQAIHTDSILESAYIEEFIEDKRFTPFPQLISTERPDAVLAKILEGQIAVIIDGTPCVLVGPITIFELFSSPEDYYQRADIATLLRWLRMFAFLLSVFVPALYIAILSFHQELLPTPLLINLSAQREGVPFPVFIEACIMMFTFELLREAGLRMPRISGQAISIVGALVIGQAAVEAGLVSAAMVIVVSITAISNFISPNYAFGIAQRIVQFSFMLLAGFMGLFGLLCGAFFLLIHLASLKSFGVEFLSPVSPMILSDLKDTLIRVPRRSMTRRPREFHPKKARR